MNLHPIKGITTCQSVQCILPGETASISLPIEELNRLATAKTDQGTLLIPVKAEDGQEFIINPNGGYVGESILISESDGFPEGNEDYEQLKEEHQKRLRLLFDNGRAEMTMEDGRKLTLSLIE